MKIEVLKPEYWPPLLKEIPIRRKSFIFAARCPIESEIFVWSERDGSPVKRQRNLRKLITGLRIPHHYRFRRGVGH